MSKTNNQLNKDKSDNCFLHKIILTNIANYCNMLTQFSLKVPGLILWITILSPTTSFNSDGNEYNNDIDLFRSSFSKLKQTVEKNTTIYVDIFFRIDLFFISNCVNVYHIFLLSFVLMFITIIVKWFTHGKFLILWECNTY